MPDVPPPPLGAENPLPQSVVDAWAAWKPGAFHQQIDAELNTLVAQYGEPAVLDALHDAALSTERIRSPFGFLRSVCQQRTSLSLALLSENGTSLAPPTPRVAHPVADKTSVGTIDRAPGSDAAKRIVRAVLHGTRLPLLAESTAVSLLEADALFQEVETAATNPHDPNETLALIELAASAIPQEPFWAKKLNRVAQFRQHFTRFYMLVRDRLEMERHVATYDRTQDPELQARAAILARLKRTQH